MFETNANVESEWRVALFCCCLEKNVSQKNSSGVAGRCFLRFFCFFYSFRFLFVCSFLHGLRMFEKNVYDESPPFEFNKTPTKRCQTLKKYSLKSLHIISHLIIIIITEISNAHEKSSLAFQRERV